MFLGYFLLIKTNKMEFTKEELTSIYNILSQVTVKIPEAQFFLDLIKKTDQMIKEVSE